MNATDPRCICAEIGGPMGAFQACPVHCPCGLCGEPGAHDCKHPSAPDLAKRRTATREMLVGMGYTLPDAEPALLSLDVPTVLR